MLLRLLTWTLLLATLAGVALWMGRDHPRVRALWPAAWPALPSTAPAVARTRKCVRGDGAEAAVTYTNDACPPGTREQALQGGSDSVLPAAPAPAPAASPARAPLRRLAGEGQGADVQQRRVDEALQR